MRVTVLLFSLALFAGCGKTPDEVKQNASAPVDNIKKNVDYLNDTKAELKEIGAKRADTVDKILDARKKNPEQ